MEESTEATENTEASDNETTDNEATVESTEDVSYTDLADQDFGTALTVGALPLVIFAVLFVVAIGVYFARKKSAWSDSDLADMKGDDEEAPSSDVEFPTTEERSKMSETEPAKKL